MECMRYILLATRSHGWEMPDSDKDELRCSSPLEAQAESVNARGYLVGQIWAIRRCSLIRNDFRRT